MRLDKFIADANGLTRSQAKKLIKDGSVSVNQKNIKQTKYQVDAKSDVVQLEGTTVIYQKYSYYMMNKPKNVVSATSDDSEKTVVDLIAETKRKGLFPVGRLDKDTTGLLLLTNDGELAHKLLSPKKHVTKIYRALIAGEVTEKTIQIFAKGITLRDGETTKPAILKILATNSKKKETKVEISITEGKYHQIKRMFGAVSMKVQELKRVQMGNLKLDEKVNLGEYRELTSEELSNLVKKID
ncbi:pseudouridine synthase [Liquorilactobacillus mali]|uniref:Pseudouridine synthase n=1 Tax=Liquorilactobacillus mali KCTC 3596 = DSM 20444 TaxID=1046596 RepID=J0KXF9_9LACO|nr:pseudouridine synthase [Liquorilactobacillus mali]EJE98240.1 ribosomal small subunit pseudouridine synthase A [Liquorilactobacillus mali KCTC 3596 = DSM 20444]KRN10474.1 ribosomal small subunit pseudouridine synthase A [Liquorilactobacillus mali KCTC 3596 = DSM 20444]MDV7757055.1 pseudouridine synthase [Liquorilactobacillus mali]QFQ75105.1 rRNA pseudouridine synthase [Liquorilactobacillus mali]